MKKRFLLIALWGLTLSVAYSQKTVKDANAVSRQVSSFHAIEISGGIDLYLSQGNAEAVAVTAENKEDRDRIVTEVENGVLKIYFEKKSLGINWRGGRKMKAYVSAKTIDALSASGGSDVQVDGTLNGSALHVSLSGGADFKGRVTMNELAFSASGGSDVSVSGKAGKLNLKASGGSDVHVYDLTSDYCTVSSSGGSDVYVTVNKEIKAEASGGSDVHYKGGAAVTSSKSGGSSVKKVG